MASCARFVHLSDSHLGPNENSEMHGVNTFAHSQAVVNEISRLYEADVPIDFVVHTGDVQNDGDLPVSNFRSNSDLVTRIWSKLPVPLYIINGNHDDVELLSQLAAPKLPTGARPSHQPMSRVGYFDRDNYRFFCLDARPSLDDGIDPQGYIPQWQLDGLEQVLEDSSTQHLSVFMHYPPLPIDCDWMDNKMLILNGMDLHRLLRRYVSKIVGCFYGHVHQGSSLHRDGILYSSVGAISCQFSSWPNSVTPVIDSRPLAFFNYVSVSGSSATIKQHAVIV